MQHLPSPDATPAPRPPLRVGLLGIGVVGSGTARVLVRNRELIAGRAGRTIDLLMVAARNLPRARALVGPDVEVLADAMRVVRHPQIDVVVEAIGGCTVARELVLEAIAHGKHVVTANKALLSEHGCEIFAAAQARGVMVAFEGAVAVSIPIVKALREGLAANRVESVAGIVNGTSNFVLTKMRGRGLSFDKALHEAQRLGYAEADPAFDVDGIDAAHKLVLLASIAFGTPVRLDAVHVEGIRALQAEDHHHAEQLGYRIKLLAVARRHAEGLELRVQPTLLPASTLLAQVDGAMNGVMVHSDAAGVTFYYGAGAGSEQTASAVIADLVDVARLADALPVQRVPALGRQLHVMAAVPALQVDELPTRNYLRLPVDDAAATLPAALRAFSEHDITVLAHRETAGEAPHAGALAFITGEATPLQLRPVLAALEGLPGVRGPVVRLCVQPLS
ncbi:homoserine dehydrogenase [Ideonella sp. BN130291]|uniref:homoserine dehydrogenase n=1 Tax=Ideonella sp. BN130291 TaxID=3112940 RepID=UPI002E263B7D|nr:homoserine dehydrogenase [Ideonella sp. BN130291]